MYRGTPTVGAADRRHFCRLSLETVRPAWREHLIGLGVWPEACLRAEKRMPASSFSCNVPYVCRLSEPSIRLGDGGCSGQDSHEALTEVLPATLPWPLHASPPAPATSPPPPSPGRSPSLRSSLLAALRLSPLCHWLGPAQETMTFALRVAATAVRGSAGCRSGACAYAPEPETGGRECRVKRR